ncbi:hypothetical protein [Streptomyces sp. NPDC056291]|uniref:hypothetical protein n=1 Tax=Streptomyces sp. NPDC056291 TaxID=3345772 RepID=UPI0035E0DBCC
MPLRLKQLPVPRPFLFGTTVPAARLHRYRMWIARGWALDLNDAVRVNAQLNRLARQAERERFPYLWGNRTAVKARRRHAHHRRIILGMHKTCTFCRSHATDIVRLVPLSQGGHDVLRNKIPVCDVCRDLWPSMSKDLTRQARLNLADGLPHRGL